MQFMTLLEMKGMSTLGLVETPVSLPVILLGTGGMIMEKYIILMPILF